jgi:hypothetical protein
MQPFNKDLAYEGQCRHVSEGEYESGLGAGIRINPSAACAADEPGTTVLAHVSASSYAMIALLTMAHIILHRSPG